MAYTAHGAVSEMKLGNNLYNHTLFNSRLQPTEIDLGTTQSGVDRLKLQYSYGTTANNGNVQSQTITVPTIGTATGYAATQSYTYDELNRLKSATEMSGSTQSWQQTFLYDRYGNRSFDPSNTSTGMVSWQLSINSVTNQYVMPQGAIHYDNAGNLDVDYNGHTFAYDGENKQTKFDGGATVAGGATYAYDGDGRRVKKVTGVSLRTTIFVYDALGQMVAEYDTATPSGSGGTSYFTADSLGTPRIITGADGSVKARHDYLPFGEELGAGTGGRTTAQGYVSDNVSQKFTGKIRDGETGLDFFGARYYGSTMGRFTSVDPVTVTPARVVDPQQLNLYSYVRNNPLALVDPTGMIIDTSRLDEDQLKRWQKIVELANAKDKDGNYVNAKLHEEYDRLHTDERTFFIENHDFGSKSGTIGEFKITKFNGDKDFSEAVIQLDFKKLKNLDSPTAANLVPGFNKFEGLFGKNGVALRDTELFGHEGAHGIFALDNVAEAVKLQMQLNDRDAALRNMPKGTKFPYPPDVMQKLEAAEKGLIPTERYAQQTEKIINGELRASSKKKD